MWGKLQILGIASSLKVLFNEAPLKNTSNIKRIQNEKSLILQRNEMIAMINTLTRFSSSLIEINSMDKLLMVKKAEERGQMYYNNEDSPYQERNEL